MKKVFTLFFAVAMVLSVTFIGEANLSGVNPTSAQAQTTVKRKKNVGAVRRVWRGGKWVGKKTWNGTKWVGKKTWTGTKYAGKKTAQGTKWVGKKSYKTGRKVVSRTKKIVY